MVHQEVVHQEMVHQEVVTEGITCFMYLHLQLLSISVFLPNHQGQMETPAPLTEAAIFVRDVSPCTVSVLGAVPQASHCHSAFL